MQEVPAHKWRWATKQITRQFAHGKTCSNVDSSPWWNALGATQRLKTNNISYITQPQAPGNNGLWMWKNWDNGCSSWQSDPTGIWWQHTATSKRCPPPVTKTPINCLTVPPRVKTAMAWVSPHSTAVATDTQIWEIPWWTTFHEDLAQTVAPTPMTNTTQSDWVKVIYMAQTTY